MTGEADKTRLPQAAPPPPETSAGTQLNGTYELDQRLASGGMGEVWRGHNIHTGDAVAIKIVLPELARDQTILSLFRKEASILNHLSHEVIVRYQGFTVDRDTGRPFLAMEFVDGRSLYDVMRDGPMPAVEAAKLFQRLAEGLAAVHEEGVFHRDLSPDNVVLPGGRVGRAKIIDFGIARAAKIGREPTVLDGRFAGKYNYVSPEQLGLFGGEVGAESDIYSLGLVMAAALRGKPLDMNGTQWEVIEKRRRVPDLAGVDERLLPLLEAMLQPEPKERPESMAVIAEWLRENFATAAPPATLRPALAPRTAAPTAGTAAGTGQPGEMSRFVPHIVPAALAAGAAPDRNIPEELTLEDEPRRGRLALAAVGLVALLLAGAAGAFYAGLLPWPVAPKHPIVLLPDDKRMHGDQKDVNNRIRKQPDANNGGDGRPIEEIDKVAERIAWLRAYPGGDCFFATATEATDKAIAIEGFGTGVAPFRRLLDAFKARFGIDPDIGVRQIAPAQCAAADFLRAVAPMAEEAPKLSLDQTAVSDGATVSGTVEVPAGHLPYLLLVDHDGMAFSLNDRLTAADGEMRFKLPIGLSAADKAEGRALPELILAISAPAGGIEAAAFRQPGPAAEVLPRILAEMRARGLEGAAAAKYFQLGG